MNYRCHKIAGLCASSAAFYYIYQHQMFDSTCYFTVKEYSLAISLGICMSGGIIGGLLPDIDHPQSTIGRKKQITSHIVHSVTGHRGLTHYPIFLLWLSFMLFIGYFALPMTHYVKTSYFLFFVGFIAGYISHIYIDLFNKKGIKLFAPVSHISFSIPVGLRLVNYGKKKKIRCKYLSGSSTSDQITCILCVIVSVFLLYHFL